MKKLTEKEAIAAVKAMTATNYDYATEILIKVFMTLSHKEVDSILKHVGRYAEKRGPDWPDWEPDENL